MKLISKTSSFGGGSITEEKETERQNSHDLRGHGNSLLELQNLVFMLCNALTNTIT